MIQRLIVLAAIVSASALVGAQPSAQHHHHHQHDASASTPHAAGASYAGEQLRDIKSLSPQEQAAWLEGQGAGLAKAAELNSFPGPMHVLEHARGLGLSAAQENDSRRLMARHKAEVRALGTELVAAERRLDDLFRTRRATAGEVSDLTQRIGALQGRIRAAHLVTHLEQTRMLSAQQIAAYDRLRGYGR
jgi:hypothetical protein